MRFEEYVKNFLYISVLYTIAVPLSKDHKPNRKYERKRIEDAGGVVIWDGKPF
jgi:hypothetical protein